MTDFAQVYEDKKCKVCGRQVVLPSGNKNSPILFIGSYPGKEEIAKGLPWIGNAGDILRTELDRVGLYTGYVRLTNVWLHEQAGDCEVGWHLDMLMWEMKQQQPRAVMVMGAEASAKLYDTPVSDITGMEVKSDYFPGSVEVSMAMVNPAIAVHGPVGEVQLAIQRFANKIDYILQEEF